MSNSSNNFSAYLLLAFLVVMSILRCRGVRQSSVGALNKGERQRPVLMTWLDPVLVVVFIGSVLWDLIARDVGHLIVALLGAAAGVPIGVARARTMYARAVKDAQSVIFRRSNLEYGLLAVLVILRIVESSIAKLHSDVATYTLTALLALAVAESLARTLDIIVRYRRETATLPG
jgi:hypothetical protein